MFQPYAPFALTVFMRSTTVSVGHTLKTYHRKINKTLLYRFSRYTPAIGISDKEYLFPLP
jgi:uncharacterized C2H2 Zn-finger protein